MPIVPEDYDRSPLNPEEQAALASLVQAQSFPMKRQARKNLLRLQQPIFDVVALRTQHDAQHHREIRKFVYEEMFRRGRSFWEWSQAEWINIICPTHKDFLSRHRLNGIRPSLIDMAYLLGGMSNLCPVNIMQMCMNTAQRIFGSEVIEQAFRRITDVLVGSQGRGYRDGPYLRKCKRTLCLLFLLNRSPYLEDLSEVVFQQAIASTSTLELSLFALLRSVLHELNLFEPSQEQALPSFQERYPDTSEVPQEWVQWCVAWLKQTPTLPLARRRRYLEIFFSAGRWLMANHHGIVSPEQWDEHIALDYVNFVCTSTAGEHASPAGIKSLVTKGIVGKPLAPRSIHNKLSAMSRLFRDLQDRPYAVGEEATRKITRRFLPHEIFATPPSIKRLIQPDPRDLDELTWCKLTYAAATFTEEDCASFRSYPVSYHRALALLWVSSARRANEIRRLRIGCIRRDWDPEMLNEHGVPFPVQNAQLCYLHVPPNKTKGPYWIPIPQYVADAIEVWEQERPKNQHMLIDPKDNSLVDFLFCFRGSILGRDFLNKSLIPALCKRAGIPERDARGAITSHRGRSTIATMLRRNGLSLDDISEFLGHAKPEMVRAYARTDPFWNCPRKMETSKVKVRSSLRE
ncbi:tyrosine-type recombinase/integrase [Dictyobacter halimunensis]|uniref:tyrosine-type recombinase/integrase n=1 Tax=Dictyobacter halimunensis TaxID=3026934 RepID=UPI0030C76DD4